jgi:hypothetical protein
MESGTTHHVLNRCNGRRRISRKAADFVAHQRVLAEGWHR